MRAQQLNRSRVNISFYSVVNFLFSITGGKFFLQWLLITNPTSKNPVCRFICKIAGLNYSTPLGQHKGRLCGGLFLFVVHLMAFFIFWHTSDGIDVFNILLNVYPMWVQVYIGLRCYRIIKLRG